MKCYFYTNPLGFCASNDADLNKVDLYINFGIIIAAIL